MRKPYILLLLCICFLTSSLSGCTILNRDKERTMVFSHWDVENEDAYKALAQEYMKQHPGLTIKVQAIAPPEYADAWLQSVSGKSIADVFAVPADENFEAFVNSGMLADLSECNILPEDYNRCLVQIGSRDGHVWAVPVTGSVPVIFYNKSFFKKCELVPPQTISDFLVNCLILQQNDIIPFAMSKDKNGLFDTTDFVEGILANGPCDTSLVSNGVFFDQNTELDSGFYDVAGLAFELTMSDLMVKGDESVSGHQLLLQQFVDGACAMFSGNSNDIRKLRELDDNLDFGFYSMPGSNTSFASIFKADMMLGISKKSKVDCDAEGFIKYLLSAKGQGLLCNMASRIPVINKVTLSDVDIAAAQALLNTADGMHPSLFQRISNDKRDICVKKMDIAFSGSYGVLDDYMLDWKTRLKALN